MKKEMLYRTAKDVDTVILDGAVYDAIDLARFIIDFEPAELIHDEKGLRLVANDEYNEEYARFRKDYLEPNIEQVKQMFKQATNELDRRMKQKEIFG